MQRPVSLDLPRVVMRRAGLVALLTVAAALLLGLARARDDTDDEVRAARSLAVTLVQLSQSAQLDDTTLEQALRTHQAQEPLRHLSLSLRDAEGRLRVGPAPEAPEALPVRMLAALQRLGWPAHAERPVTWPLARADGSTWTLTLAASPQSEQREALSGLAGLLAVLAAGAVAMLGAMALNIRHALRPLQALLGTIDHLRDGDTAAAGRVGTLPMHELESIRQALATLGDSLAQAEGERRLLGQRMATVQEDERERLAAELHDELGQRVTALRVDLAWLLRQQCIEPPARGVVEGLAAQCEALQHDVRALLARLQPLGPGSGGLESPARLVALLQPLVHSWQAGVSRELAVRLELQGWPQGAAAEQPLLPRALVVTLYRISQEALTNVARHAAATQAELRLTLEPASDGAAGLLRWEVMDDGSGLPEAAYAAAPQAVALQRGNGLAGIRERVWAQGGELQIGPATPGAARPGLSLRARFDIHAPAAQPPTDSTSVPR